MSEKIKNEFDELLSTIYQMKNSITILQNQVKLMEKDKNKTIRRLEKELFKKRQKRQRQPSGFAKPTKISNKLCEFINPDKKLSDLLNTDKEDNITYFNIQGFMNQHFIKSENELELTN